MLRLIPLTSAADISIHALREEGDFAHIRDTRARNRISIHALREEGDERSTSGAARLSVFLSTPSARRATCAWTGKAAANQYFYPRPPRGGRPIYLVYLSTVLTISIHALREEGDLPADAKQKAWTLFLSTPSARRATMQRSGKPTASTYFYPRPPRGGRPKTVSRNVTALRFLSTPSARRATWHNIPPPVYHSNFYPRPPRGGRLFPSVAVQSRRYFYPRPPRGGRRFVESGPHSGVHISIHALREEGDGRWQGTVQRHPHISIHALREEGDQQVMSV